MLCIAGLLISDLPHSCYVQTYRDTALAILSEKEGLKALEIKYGEELTPLRMLIKEMPGN